MIHSSDINLVAKVLAFQSAEAAKIPCPSMYAKTFFTYWLGPAERILTEMSGSEKAEPDHA